MSAAASLLTCALLGLKTMPTDLGPKSLLVVNHRAACLRVFGFRFLGDLVFKVGVGALGRAFAWNFHQTIQSNQITSLRLLIVNGAPWYVGQSTVRISRCI